MDLEERRFGYLRDFSKEELEAVIKECKFDIDKYHEAREDRINSEELTELEKDFNYAMSKVRYLSKIVLFEENKTKKM